MAAWAEIEYGLSLWFKSATGLEYNVAQNLFFSGRAFSTRRDLFATALTTANMPDNWREFAIAALDKAQCYSSARNRLAHGLMHPTKLDENGQPTDWKIKEQEQWQDQAGLDYNEISIIAENFQALGSILTGSHYPYTRSEQPKEFVRQLRERPNEANSTQLSQKQIARLNRLQSSED